MRPLLEYRQQNLGMSSFGRLLSFARRWFHLHALCRRLLPCSDPQKSGAITSTLLSLKLWTDIIFFTIECYRDEV